MEKGGEGGERSNAELLTQQEIQVLKALARCGSVPQIADSLGSSPHTVETHLKHIRAKCGLHHVAQLVSWGYENGLLTTGG